RDIGARAISIKGPVLEHYGLRPPRQSTDADVWIDEAHREAVTLTLEGQGWEKRRDRGENQARVLPDHSATYFHPSWPVDIDVHWWFPGFGVDGTAAFERIWARRTSMQAAGSPITIPSIVDAAAIQMLHCAKQTTSLDRVHEFAGAIQRVKAWPAYRLDELVDRLVELNATDPLQAAFEAADIAHLENQWTPRERLRWSFAAETDQSGSTAAILYQLWNAPWTRKPRGLREAIWPNKAELIATDMQHDSSKKHVRAIRYQRWIRGMRALPEAAAALARLVLRSSRVTHNGQAANRDEGAR
ncbi:MAG: nucleotidyltransferase family protein, partial [Bifidobacterium crudilactis]|nr:nucleotidyltransferase family protein [Bifidobacterium crudilactis]